MCCRAWLHLLIKMFLLILGCNDSSTFASVFSLMRIFFYLVHAVKKNVSLTCAYRSFLTVRFPFYHFLLNTYLWKLKDTASFISPNLRSTPGSYYRAKYARIIYMATRALTKAWSLLGNINPIMYKQEAHRNVSTFCSPKTGTQVPLTVLGEQSFCGLWLTYQLGSAVITVSVSKNTSINGEDTTLISAWFYNINCGKTTPIF